MRTRGSTVAVHQSDELKDELKFVCDSAKGGATKRKIKTAKLPTSMEELRKLDHEHRSAEQRILNPSGRGSNPR
jgi:hypothetical protein